MNRVFVEPSGESPSLAEAEAVAAAEALGGRRDASPSPFAGLVPVELPLEIAPRELANRLALARRCLVPLGDPESADRVAEGEGPGGHTAAFRRLGGPGRNADGGVLAAGRAYARAGGRIDLDTPERRFWVARGPEGTDRLLEEAATVDRPATARRRMPLLPFRRPVGLPPRLARAAANLARVRSGDRVVDPFLGTGALLAEAGLLGGRLYGIDRDVAMVRGALENFAHLGVTAEELVVGDATDAEFGAPPDRFDALLTDPPYGRSSSTGGEAADRLVERIVPRWGDRLAPGGRVVLVAPSGTVALPSRFVLKLSVPVRVHRSLTREFRVYERGDGG